MAIEISDKAVDEVRRMMEKESVNAAGLRVGVKGGGCSGLSYNLSFESQTRTGDKVFERYGPRLRQRLDGQRLRVHESEREEKLRLWKLILNVRPNSGSTPFMNYFE